MIIRICVLLVMMFITNILNSYGFDYVMGFSTYTSHTISKPSKRSYYVDPSFNTIVRRVTDYEIENGGLGSVRIGYGTWSPESSDGKYLCFMTGNGSGYAIWQGVNGTTPYAFYKDISSTMQWYNSQDPEPRWDQSGNHPSWIYYRKNMQLRRLDVETNADVLVHDFNGIVINTVTYKSAAGWYVWNGEEGNADASTRYWPFMVGKSNTNIPAFFIYDLTTDSVVSSKAITNGSAPNNVMMSPSGDYVYVAYSPVLPYSGDMTNPGVYPRLNLSGSGYKQTSAAVPHAAWVGSMQGHEGMINLWPGGTNADYLVFTRADNGKTFKLAYQGQMDPGWRSNFLHAQGVPGKPGWAFMSTYATSQPGSWVNNQLFAIEVDETKTVSSQSPPVTKVWRIAFLQNVIDTACYYFQQPNAAINVAGTRVFWGSNWRFSNCSTPIHMDVLQAELPTTWYTDLSGGSQRH